MSIAALFAFALGVLMLLWDTRAHEDEPSSVESFFSRMFLVLCTMAFIVFLTFALMAHIQ